MGLGWLYVFTALTQAIVAGAISAQVTMLISSHAHTLAVCHLLLYVGSFLVLPPCNTHVLFLTLARHPPNASIYALLSIT